MSITKVIKNYISANTIAKIQEDSSNLNNAGITTVGLTDFYYTDENYANTANTSINETTGGYIKIFGYGFKPNANLFLRPSTNVSYEISPSQYPEDWIPINSYYVNFNEYRAQANVSLGSFENYDLVFVNENGTNFIKDKRVKVVPNTSLIKYGWFIGGISTSGGDYKSTVEKINFHNDTAVLPRGNLSTPKRQSATTSNTNFSWVAGGQSTPGIISSIEKINFSSDTSTSTVVSNLSLERSAFASVKNSLYGWFGGGYTTSSVRISTIERIDFSNDSAGTTVRSNLATLRDDLCSSWSNQYGWFFSGSTNSTGGTTSRTERIDFSNDTAAPSVRTPTQPIYGNFSSRNSNYCWIIGGRIYGGSDTYSHVSRLSFSNDTQYTFFRTYLPYGLGQAAATSNEDYSWIGGGWNVFSTTGSSAILRMNHSDDTSLVTTSSFYLSPRYQFNATTNS